MHIRQPVTVEKTPEKVPKLVHNVHHFRAKKNGVFLKIFKRSSLGKKEVEGFSGSIV